MTLDDLGCPSMALDDLQRTFNCLQRTFDGLRWPSMTFSDLHGPSMAFDGLQ